MDRTASPLGRAPRVAVARPLVVASVAVACALAVGCAGERRPVPTSTPEPTAEAVATGPDAPSPAVPDTPPVVRHVVAAGQTAWRIAAAYGISVDALAKANGLSDPTRLEVGQVLRIPGARHPIDVPPFPAPVPSPPRETEPRAAGSSWADLIWPVEGGEVLSGFGAPRASHRHRGLDIRARKGQDVVAAAAGTVTFAGLMRGYGRTVIVDHGHGLSTLYAHNSGLVVRVGQRVAAGEVLAHAGSSGNATTTHCHFEVREHGVAVDPLDHLRPAVAEGRP